MSESEEAEKRWKRGGSKKDNVDEEEDEFPSCLFADLQLSVIHYATVRNANGHTRK